MIALLPLLLMVACKGEPSPLDDFVDQMEDPEWCPTSWEDGVWEAFYEAECRHSNEICDRGILEICMAELESTSTPSCIRGCDVRECVEWYVSDDCDYDNRPDSCYSVGWCE